MFDLASVSKCVGTTLAAMQLIERGEIRPKDEVRYFFPEFRPWIDPETGEKVHITIQDLMSHSSGLSPYIDVAAFVNRFGENQPDSLMRFIATEVKRNFRPRTEFMYSCLNYITLQHIIQQVSGRPLNEYVEENIFQPLGLEHTCYFPLGADLRTPVAHQELIPLCAPTEVQADGLPLVAAVHDPIARRINAGVSGNAGVFSNAADLTVLCQAILNNGGDILLPATVRMMCTIPPENEPNVGRALGWDKKSDHSGLKGDYFNPNRTIEHTGYTGTSLVLNFDSKTALIILTNRVHPNDDGAVGRMRALIANVVGSSVSSSYSYD
jgi:CubicO group peptidase (beta-lactamase class C family)